MPGNVVIVLCIENLQAQHRLRAIVDQVKAYVAPRLTCTQGLGRSIDCG